MIVGLFQSRGEWLYLESHSSKVWEACERLQQVILEMCLEGVCVRQEGKLGPWLAGK